MTGVNPCTGTTCAGGTSVIRVYPPTTAGGFDYTAISQEFRALSSTTYSLGFFYRCLNAAATSGIDVYYNGQRLGGVTCPTVASAQFRQASDLTFTTDATGVGQIEVRFLNPTLSTALYFYADAFRASAIS